MFFLDNEHVEIDGNAPQATTEKAFFVGCGP